MLVPAFIVTLFAEFGGGAVAMAMLPSRWALAALLALGVAMAAFAGASLAPAMNADACTLTLGAVLILAGFGQLRKLPSLKQQPSWSAILLLLSRSSLSLIAFGFAVWREAPFTAAAGVAAGGCAAVALNQLALSPGAALWTRRALGTVLILAGLCAALSALRLVM